MPNRRPIPSALKVAEVVLPVLYVASAGPASRLVTSRARMATYRTIYAPVVAAEDESTFVHRGLMAYRRMFVDEIIWEFYAAASNFRKT